MNLHREPLQSEIRPVLARGATRPSTALHNPPRAPHSPLHNLPQPSTAPSTTLHNPPQPSTALHNPPQPTTSLHNPPKRGTNSELWRLWKKIFNSTGRNAAPQPSLILRPVDMCPNQKGLPN